MSDPVAAIARTVLYEGYVLWPYHRSALKNQKRWTFGGVYPEAYSAAGHQDDASAIRAECLLEIDTAAELEVTVRFLQVVDRLVARVDDGRESFVDRVVVRGESHVAWQEAMERDITLSLSAPEGRDNAAHADVVIDAGESREPLIEHDGTPAAAVVRRWDRIAGTIDVETEPADRGVVRVRVHVRNQSQWTGESRDEIQRRTLVATHVVLRSPTGRFISPIDPPAAYAAAVSLCRNSGVWPVLVGTPPERGTMLASPIILYDYPQVAPESGGDFFDAAEIDQLLVLGVLSMTDEEQARMRETDPRTRQILERCRSVSADELLRLHGATRELRGGEAEQ